MKKKLIIEGMSCGHCVKHTTNALNDVAGVSNVEVNLQDKYAIVEGENLVDGALKEAVDEAGYTVTVIETL